MNKAVTEVGQQVAVTFDKVINQLILWVSDAKNFASEQLPDLFKQIVLYKTVMSGLMVLACLCALPWIFKTAKKVVGEGED